jgi:hypothetical protein
MQRTVTPPWSELRANREWCLKSRSKFPGGAHCCRCPAARDNLRRCPLLLDVLLTQARTRFVFLSISDQCTVTLTVVVLLAMFGSGVSAMVAAFSVITVPEGAVTFTVKRTVHVVFGAMLLFSWQTICPVP